MAKRPSKSISDLVGKKKAKPSLEEINKIADQIHTQEAAKLIPTETSKPNRDISNRTKRISLNAPLELYLEIQREATMQGKPMMQYILEVVKKDIESKS